LLPLHIFQFLEQSRLLATWLPVDNSRDVYSKPLNMNQIAQDRILV